jgi:hypothetical protein
MLKWWVVNGQNTVPSDFIKCSTNINFENWHYGKSWKKIKRKNKDIISLYFFQDFSDTVIVYINNEEVMRRYVYHDSDLVSTKFTGETFSYLYSLKSNIITIAYKASKRYVEFVLDKRYPLYAIHAYEKNCFVSGRKYQMIIK